MSDSSEKPIQALDIVSVSTTREYYVHSRVSQLASYGEKLVNPREGHPDTIEANNVSNRQILIFEFEIYSLMLYILAKS